MKQKTLAVSSLLILAIVLGPIGASAQTWTSTTTTSGNTVTVASTSTATSKNQTTTSTSTTTAATSTATTTPSTSTSTTAIPGGTVQQKLVVLQTQVVVLFGQLVAEVTNQAASNPDANLQTAVKTLQLGWIGMAQNQISLLRLAFQI